MEKFCNDFAHDEKGNLFQIVPKLNKDGNVVAWEPIEVANHTPILKELLVVDNGIERCEELKLEILRGGKRYQVNEPYTLNDIHSSAPQKKFGFGCYIVNGKGTVSLYRLSIQEQCDEAQPSYAYEKTGYKVIDGKRVFLNGENSVTVDGLTTEYTVRMTDALSQYCFKTGKDEKRFDTLRKFFSVAPLSVVYAGLAYVFLTPLNALLREVGHEPNFILYIIGKTGMRKTSMAKALLSFFGRFDSGGAAPSSFTDTLSALELKFALTDSTLMLLDDRTPSTTASIRAQMEKIEQEVNRMIGDRRPKSRANADISLKANYRPQCNLIITGEDAYQNVGESGVARSISVELNSGDINLDILTELQHNAVHLNQCMSDYIQYILQHWDELKERLLPIFEKYRDEEKEEGHGRLRESVSFLRIGFTSMCAWLQSIGQMTKEEADERKKEAKEIFRALAKAQDKRIKSNDPVEWVIDVIREKIDREDIILKGRENTNGIAAIGTKGKSPDVSPDGFIDDKYYYLFPDRLMDMLNLSYRNQFGTEFPLSRKSLFSQLSKKGAIEKDKGADQYTKQISNCIANKKPRLLCFRRTAIDREEEKKRCVRNGERLHRAWMK